MDLWALAHFLSKSPGLSTYVYVAGRRMRLNIFQILATTASSWNIGARGSTSWNPVNSDAENVESSLNFDNKSRSPHGLRIDKTWCNRQKVMSMSKEEVESKVVVMELHPRDYGYVERAAQKLGYSPSEFMLLSATLMASAIVNGDGMLATPVALHDNADRELR